MDVRSRVDIYRVQEPFEGNSVVQVFARVQLAAGIYPAVVKDIENRSPAPGKFRKSRVHQARAANVSCSAASNN